MNINNSSTYSVSASSSKGISGLASGLDTDSWVEQMLSGTQKKIDTQKGLQWQTEQKQTIYRDIISSINSFKSKYFDTSFGSQLSTNFAKSDFFDSMLSTVTSGSQCVKVLSTSSSASVGNMNIVVNRLASTASVKTEAGKRLSTDSISGGTITADTLKNYEKTVEFNVDASGTNQAVKVNLAGASSQQEVVSRINSAFQNALGDDSVTVRMHDNRLRITTKDTDTTVSVTGGSELGLAVTGLGDVANRTGTDENGNNINILQGNGMINPDNNVSFNITLNGVSKQITINPLTSQNPDGSYAALTLDDIASELSKQVQAAFGGTTDGNGNVSGGYIDLVTTKTDTGGVTDSLSFTFSTTGDSQFSITGVQANEIGITPGSSSKISGSTKLRDLAGIQGQEYKFTINNQEFTFSANDSISTMINKINNSGAGVRMTYSSISDSFQLESSSSGSKYSITMSQEQGNVLSTIFGDGVISAGSTAGSRKMVSGSIQGNSSDSMPDLMESATFSILINGEKKTFNVDPQEGKVYRKGDILDGLNNFLAQYGDIKYNRTTGQIEVGDNSIVEFTQTSIDLNDPDEVNAAKKSDLALILGFNTKNQSNVAASTADLSTSEKTILQNLGILDGAGALVNGFAFQDGRVVANDQAAYQTIAANAAADPDKQKQLEDLFGKNPLNFGTGAADTTKISAGVDAELTVNGTQLKRSSNQFTIDGVTMELTGVSNAGESSTISTTRDVEKIVEGFKSFVEDYNAMLEKLNGYVDEEANYRKYPPLTAAQKKEMSEKEIEQWEEKAKEGLLRRDNDVEMFLSSMRTTLYTKPSSSNYALYDIGIETGRYSDKGKLQFDETTLRNALANDPDSVKALFTDVEDGLAKQLTNIMNATANMSSGSPGTLVALAGVKGLSSEKNNTLTSKIESIKDRIKDLTHKYEKERQRYWKQFNTMEQILSNFNTQSSYISQQFGGI